jgi:hypothetical protein
MMMTHALSRHDMHYHLVLLVRRLDDTNYGQRFHWLDRLNLRIVLVVFHCRVTTPTS